MKKGREKKKFFEWISHKRKSDKESRWGKIEAEEKGEVEQEMDKKEEEEGKVEEEEQRRWG